jgi:hypothetical protein
MEERDFVEPLLALDLIENTGAYKQFHYGDQRSAATLAAPEAPPAAELDEIWSTV